MLEEQGVVVTVGASSCVVELGVAAACSTCTSRCGTGATPAVRRINAKIVPEWELHPGDRVIVGVSGGRTLLAAAALYLGSVLALLGGAGIFRGLSQALWPSAGDAAALCGAALFFGAYLLAMRRRGWIEAVAATPTIRRRLEP